MRGQDQLWVWHARRSACQFLASPRGGLNSREARYMKLVLCDDHRILCEALAAALEDHGHQVLAVTTTATAGVTAVAAHDPDVCLLDLCFPDVENGLDAARTIT